MAKFKPKYLRENNRAFQELTYYAANNGWLEFRQDIAPIEADKFFSKYAKDLGIKDDYQFRSTKDKTDRERNRHRHYQLYYRGILVEGALYALHSRDGLLTTAHGRIPDDLTLDVGKPMPEKQALDIALIDRKLTSDNFKGDAKLPKGELVLTSIDGDLIGSSFRLAYYFDFSGKQPADFVRVYVDATIGIVLKREPLLSACFGHPDHTHTDGCDHKVAESKIFKAHSIATAPKIAGTFTPVNYSSNRYLPAGQTTRTFEIDPFGGSGSQLTAGTNILQALDTRNDDNNNLVFDDLPLTTGSTNWGTNRQTATTTHWVAYQSYLYFRSILDPFNENNGTDGQGRIARILIQPQIEGAFWEFNQRLMLVGSNFGNGRVLSTIDIVAHEYGHGMSQQLIGGIWDNGIPRSLNEGFSDIIGTEVERQLLPDGVPQQWNWTLGEDALLLRNMANPTQFGMPQWFQGPGWDFAGTRGPHHNSAVLSRWFHALVTGNTPRANFPINGIGFDDAMRVVYKGLNSYIMPNATYEDVSDAMRLAARDVFGGCSPQQRSVIAAWNAVDLPFNQPCDPLYCNRELSVAAPSSANCGQTVTVTSTCNTPNGNNLGCDPNIVSFNFYNQAGSYIGAGSSFNIVAPSSATTAQYTVRMTGGLYCFVPARTFNLNVNCTNNGGCTQQAISVVAPTPNQTLTTSTFPFYFDIQTQTCDPQGISQVQYSIVDGNGNLSWAGYVDTPNNNSTQPYTYTAARWASLANSDNAYKINQPGTYTIYARLFSNSGGFLDASPVQITVVQGGGGNPPNPGGGLAFATPTFDCNTGQLVVSTTGGNGQPVEFRAPGLQDWNTNNVFNVPAHQRNGTTFTIQARQSGNEIPSLNYTTSCPGYRFAAVGAEETESGLLLAPNPTQGPFTVRFRLPARQTATLSVVNVVGQSVWQRDVIGTGQTQTETVDINREPTGQYVVRLKATNGTQTGKLLLAR